MLEIGVNAFLGIVALATIALGVGLIIAGISSIDVNLKMGIGLILGGIIVIFGGISLLFLVFGDEKEI